MYEEFYGLDRRPFSAIASAEEFVTTPAIQTTLENVVHAIVHDGGIAVVTAEPGIGKTAFCKRIAGTLGQDFRTIYLNCSGIETRRALLQAILFELNADYVGLSEQEARLQLFHSVRNLSRNELKPVQALVLTLDEAHLLPLKLFEELKVLCDYAPDGRSLIRFLLTGLFELEEKLTEPELSALGQRIAFQGCLQPLTVGESAQVLGRRFAECGANDLQNVMTEPALSMICRASDGNFRCLTQLTDQSLVLGFEESRRPLDGETVRQALENLKELPLRWNEVGLGESEAEPTLDHVLLEGAHENSFQNAAQDDQQSLTSNQQNFSNWLDSFTLEAEELETSGFSDDDENSFTSFLPPSSPPSIGLPQSISEQVDQRPAPEFAVFEVGGEDSAHPTDTSSFEEIPIQIDTQQGTEKLMEEQFKPGFVSLNSDPFFVPMSAPVAHDTDMAEVAVLDRYTLLDRQLELPKERQYLFDESVLQDLPHELLSSSFHEIPEDFKPAGSLHESAGAELQMLETIQRIRQEVLAQSSVQTTIQPLPQLTPRFDIVQPDLDFVGTIPFSSAEAPPATVSFSKSLEPTPRFVPREEPTPEQPSRPIAEESAEEGRFSKLFTRLRLRKDRYTGR